MGYKYSAIISVPRDTNGDLIVLTGDESSGKTSFVLTITRYLAVKERIPVLYFSLSQTEYGLMSRFISGICEVETENLQKADLRKEDLDKIDKGAVSEVPIYICDFLGLSIDEIKALGEMFVEKGVRLMIIDDLHLITTGNRTFNSRQEEYRYISEELKNLASRLNIPIIVICETSYLQEKLYDWDNNHNLLNYIHEFGAIEQYASMVLYLRKLGVESYDFITGTRSNTELIIAKHRDGPTKPVHLYFVEPFSDFRENLYYLGQENDSDEELPF